MEDNRYARSYPIDKDAVKSRYYKHQIVNRERSVRFAESFAHKAEILNTEKRGFIELDPSDPDDKPFRITQTDILKDANLLTKSKHFEIFLSRLGPYFPRYTRNGRFLLLTGLKGHSAAFDWQTKQILFEMNVSEHINDACWLHDQSFFAVAQKRWTYVYDNQGVEVHCLKVCADIQHLDFLPYHFILSAINSSGFLSYIDISTGKIISVLKTGKFGIPYALRHNPTTGVSLVGHSNGSVTLWTPNSQENCAEIQCHRTTVTDACFDTTGNLLYTTAMDHQIKIFDVRTFGLLGTHSVRYPINGINVSQTGLVCLSQSHQIEIFRDLDKHERSVDCRYMTEYSPNWYRTRCEFCPFEDVLAIGHAKGLTSILVPGAGEANFDAYECNPYQTTKQRAFWEVNALLDKIPAEMITFDPDKLANVDVRAAYDLLEKKHEAMMAKKPNIVLQLKNKKRQKSKISKRIIAKRQAREREIKRAVSEYEQAAQKAGVVAPFNSKRAKEKRMEEKKMKKRKLASGEGYNLFDRFKQS